MSTTPKAAMTRKEALSLIYQLRDAYVGAIIAAHQFDQQEALRLRSLDALSVLTQAVYGVPRMEQFSFLCDVCQRRYAEHFAHEREKCMTIWCCTPCRAELQAQRKLVETATAQEGQA